MASFTIETFSLERLSDLTPEKLNERYEEFSAMVAL